MCSHNSCIRCTDLVLTQAVSWNNGSTQALCSKQSEIHLRLSSTRNCFSHSLISSSLSRFFKEKEVCMQDKCQTSKSSENTPQRQGKCPFQSFGSCAQSFQWHVWLGGFVYFFLPTELPVQHFWPGFPLPWAKPGKHKLLPTKAQAQSHYLPLHSYSALSFSHRE